MPLSGLHLHPPSRASSQASSKKPPRPPLIPTTQAPHRKPLFEDVDSDKASVLTRSSTVSNVKTEDAMLGIAGERVRHAKCPPEFLEAMAGRDDPTVNIITGLEASTFFVKYLGEQDGGSQSRRHSRYHDSQAVVFAVTVWEYKRKCVDYYMTWRKKNNDNPLKESKIKELDEEFRRVAKRIDQEYKAARRAGSAASTSSRRSTGTSRSTDTSRSTLSPHKRERTRSPHHGRKHRPEALPLSIPDSEECTKAAAEPLPSPPASATDSVISLPYLNMIRGVPRGNRLPLFIANPDNPSTDSLVESPKTMPSELADDTAERHLHESPTPLVVSITPPTDVPPISAMVNRSTTNVGLTPIMKSSASIRSTETRSSKSSTSSQDSTRSSELDTPNEHHHNSLPAVEEEFKNDFLIVVLGDKLEKEGLSWHGLEREVSTKRQQAPPPPQRNSPWIAPLTQPQEYSPMYLVPPSTQNSAYDSESDGENDGEGWRNLPVVPLKPFLESIGFVPSPGQDVSGYYTPAPPAAPLPGTATYNMTGPPRLSLASPYTPASTARPRRVGTYPSVTPTSSTGSAASPYSLGWRELSYSNGSSPYLSRAPSRAPSMGSYGSPYIGPAY